MSYSLSEEAARELAAAFDYLLEHASQKVAERFLDEFERAARLVDASPGLGTPTLGGRRIFPLRRFPYSLIYRVSDGNTRIGAVAHQNRKPKYWGRRS